MKTAIAMLLITLGLLAGPARAQSSDFRYDTIELAPGLYTFRYLGARTVFLVTDDGVLIADPLGPEAAVALRREIATLTDQPVRYVVYSHQHWDHVRGARIFKDEGATIVSHRNCLAHFQRDPHPDVVMPDMSYEVKHTIELGEAAVELWWFGPNHSDCTTFIYFPAAKLVHIVDVVTPGMVAAASGQMSDLYPLDYIQSLRTLEETLDFTGMVGGHGVPVAPRSAVTVRREYQEALMRAVKAEIDKGTPFNDIPGRIELPQFSHLQFYDELLARNAQRILIYYTIGW
jgi:glyoxylase-like metal-dependent hydrolase (beta-lactamase superfamily II)